MGEALARMKTRNGENIITFIRLLDFALKRKLVQSIKKGLLTLGRKYLYGYLELVSTFTLGQLHYPFIL